MSYSLTRGDLASITDAESIFGTDRLLPPWDDVPASFRDGNAYCALVAAMLGAGEPPDIDIALRPAFRDREVLADLDRCLRAHFRQPGDSLAHKVAAIGFLLAHVCEIGPGRLAGKADGGAS